MALRYSQLKDKPKHRLKAMMTKFNARIAELMSIERNSKKLGIPLSEETRMSINRRLMHYFSEHFHVYQVMNGVPEKFINFKK